MRFNDLQPGLLYPAAREAIVGAYCDTMSDEVMRKGAKHYAPDGKRSEKGRTGKPKKSENDPSADLLKLKKRDLLEIMLRQGEEIDSLRARISDLEAQLESREINMLKSGSIAEASLALTKVFEEAQKAADIYLENVKRKAANDTAASLYNRGAGFDEK